MRKILIIIISILLFSYLLVSCQKEDDVLYRWDDDKKGFEWKTFGDDNTQPKYRGEISDVKPNGLGTLTLPNGENYVGEWKDDKKHGLGTETYPNGSKYVGEFKKGKRLRKKLFPGISPLSE